MRVRRRRLTFGGAQSKNEQRKTRRWPEISAGGSGARPEDQRSISGRHPLRVESLARGNRDVSTLALSTSSTKSQPSQTAAKKNQRNWLGHSDRHTVESHIVEGEAGQIGFCTVESDSCTAKRNRAADT